MIYYNSNTINDWNFGDDNIIKVYKHGAVCYYKITSGDTPTPVQEPCFAVVDDITQYTDTEFEDVFNKADNKWYKLNNLNTYEEYGIYGSGRTSCEGSASRLPQGYTEVEYIENTGTSYINTNIQVYSSTTDSFEIETKLIAAKHDSQTYQNVFSCMSEDGEPYQGFTYRYQSSSLVGTSIPNGQNTFTIVNNEDSTQTVTVTSSSSQRTYTHTYPLTLFCGLNSSRSPFRWTNSKFYYCKIRMNNELVGDFVPCKRDSDDKYGMYDIVNDVFYVSPNNVDFSGGEPITPTDCVTTYEGKLTIDDGYEYQYSGGSWVNVGEVSGSTATLPNVPFTVNYNAKNYNSSTKTLLKTSGQLADVDAVITAGTPTVHDNYLTIATGTRATISGYQTYFNRDNNNPNLTIISKQTTDGSNCHIFANRDGNYNWMYRPYSTKLTLHGGSETGQLAVTTQPVIESARVDSSRNVKYNNYTDNTTSTTSSFRYGSTNSGKFALFQGYATNTGENFVGDFYWVYMSQNTLTDEQVQQVIDYNEGGGEPEYPIYYDEIQDPPDNVTFTSMTEAESYECPWWGMTAIIDNTDYLFCESNEWLTKYAYQEVSGEYLCDSGNKYKKMQEYDRLVDGTMSATTNYVIGDLIESGSPDCAPQFISLQDLASTYPTGTVSHGYRFTNYSDVSGITYFRYYPSKGTSQSSYVYADHNADNATGTTKFAIKADANGSLWSSIGGYSSLKAAADATACTWAYWIDADTIEIDVVAAVGTTIFIKQWQTNFVTDIIAYKFE